MNPKTWQWLAAVVALCAMLPAHAQMGSRRAPPSEIGNSLAPSPHQAQYAPPRDVQLRQESMESAQPMRMSPEERRQLRRDIHEAGRELYRRDLQRPRP